MLGLINYCVANNDMVISSYIDKLAGGMAMMQQGDATHFPFSAFLSWQNTWHAYGNLQAYALMQAADFLHNPQYNLQALAEVDNFYPWLLQNGFKSNFTINDSAGVNQILSENSYDQIAYGIEPMVFAEVNGAVAHLDGGRLARAVPVHGDREAHIFARLEPGDLRSLLVCAGMSDRHHLTRIRQLAAL
jgi:hypothetical protein